MSVELTKLLTDLNVIQSLPDKPSLASAELKQKFDEAVNSIKTFINDTHIVELLAILGDLTDDLTALSNAYSSNKTTTDQTISTMQNKLNGIENGANNYVHPTSSGNKHIPSGGSSGQILRWSSAGTATWGADNNTTYSVATTSTAGLMSASDKTKLNGVATGATKNTVENVLTSTNTSNALSAAQGKILNDTKQKIITRGTSAPSGGSNGDIYIQYFT